MSLLNPAGLLARIREEAEGLEAMRDVKTFPAIFKEACGVSAKRWRKLESDIEAELLAAKEKE